MCRKKRKKSKRRTSWHHRKCRSLGGTDCERNLVRVCAEKHNLWHTIFGNMHALQIQSEIQKFFLPHLCISSVCVVSSPGPVVFGSNEASRLFIRKEAWNKLFANMDEELIIMTINQKWIDPDFILTFPKNAKYYGTTEIRISW